jgi:hypothetical protein
MLIKIRKIFFSSFLLTVLNCSNADPKYPGRCPIIAGALSVASATDTDGSPWSFLLAPDKIELNCEVAGQQGAVEITGFIRDGKNNLKSGISAGPVMTSGNGISLDKANIESATDACGMIKYVIKWTCPAQEGHTVNGLFYAFSGSLISPTVNVSLTHSTKEEPVPTISVGGTTKTTAPTTTTPTTTPATPTTSTPPTGFMSFVQEYLDSQDE